MSPFTCRWDSAPSLPDDHLIAQEITPTAKGVHIDVRMRAGHISETLIRDLDEYFRHLSRADAYEVDPTQAGNPPEFTTSYELRDPSLLPLRTFAVKITGTHYTFCVRRGHMSTALVHELNDDFLPSVNGMLRTRAEPPTTVERPVIAEALDQYGARGLVAA